MLPSPPANQNRATPKKKVPHPPLSQPTPPPTSPTLQNENRTPAFDPTRPRPQRPRSHLRPKRPPRPNRHGRSRLHHHARHPTRPHRHPGIAAGPQISGPTELCLVIGTTLGVDETLTYRALSVLSSAGLLKTTPRLVAVNAFALAHYRSKALSMVRAAMPGPRGRPARTAPQKRADRAGAPAPAASEDGPGIEAPLFDRLCTLML